MFKSKDLLIFPEDWEVVGLSTGVGGTGVRSSTESSAVPTPTPPPVLDIVSITVGSVLINAGTTEEFTAYGYAAAPNATGAIADTDVISENATLANLLASNTSPVPTVFVSIVEPVYLWIEITLDGSTYDVELIAGQAQLDDSSLRQYLIDNDGATVPLTVIEIPPPTFVDPNYVDPDYVN